jgi:predicted TIM-barrel fold metal-dependent hydrolase
MIDHVDQFFDCDNHYYESLDAFTRHLEPEFARRAVQWATMGGRERLLVGEKVHHFIPNPTFDPIAKPGSLDEYFRGRNPKGADTRELFGELDRMIEHPEYRDRDARLRVMDEQGMLGGIFLPSLGVGIEQALLDDVPALLGAFRAFNRWIDEDWGFAYQDRIFAPPIFSLVDKDEAVKELEWALARDARFVLMVPGPVITPAGGRSPADPEYDPFWARINEAGVTVVYHGGDSFYTTYLGHWGERSDFGAFRQDAFRALVSHSAVQDQFASMLSHDLFHRFPNLRVASIENGSSWVFHLYEKLTTSFGQTPNAYAEDPRATFKRHVWVSPYYEDELARLRDLLGADRLLMGSDFPHAEGLADPGSYIKDLEAFDFTSEECVTIMRENGLALSKRRTL